MTREARANLLRTRFKAKCGLVWVTDPDRKPKVKRRAYRPGGFNPLYWCEPTVNVRRCPAYFRTEPEAQKGPWVKRNSGPSVLGRIAKKLNRKLPIVTF